MALVRARGYHRVGQRRVLSARPSGARLHIRPREPSPAMCIFPLRCVLPFCLVFTGVSLVFASPSTFVERNGVVSIEAEHATDRVGPWEEVEGRNAHELNHGTSLDHRAIVRAPSHPLAAGLSGEIRFARNLPLHWGFPGEHAATVVVAAHDPRKAIVYGYERGAVLPDGRRAPGRRIHTTAPRAEAPETGALFDAALAWAAEGNAAPRTALLIVAGAEPSTSDQEIARRLGAGGFAVTTLTPAEVTGGHTDGFMVLVIGPSPRFETLEGKFRDSPTAIVLADKRPLAGDLGLVPPPIPTAPEANAVLIRNGSWTDHLRYAIHFTTPGTYHLWALGQSGGDPGTDEVKVFFNERPDPRSERFFELRLPPLPDWSGLAFARLPGNRKAPVPAVIEVPAPGWYNLHLAKGAEPEHHGEAPPLERRYPNWRVDKLVLLRTDTLRPHGDGPPETRNDGAIEPPSAMLAQTPWLPPQIWPLRDGFVAIEAEDIAHHANWVLAHEPAGFTGAGYLEWRGPSHTVTIEGHFGNNDHLHIRQGSRQDWLIVRLDVEEAGTYRLDVRNHHLREDGDNDAWIARLHQRGRRDAPIVRIGDSLRDGPGFSWLDWGVPVFNFERGLNEVRIGGRSVGFGVDRIALYREADEAAKARALDPRTPAARPLDR